MKQKQPLSVVWLNINFISNCFFVHDAFLDIAVEMGVRIETFQFDYNEIAILLEKKSASSYNDNIGICALVYIDTSQTLLANTYI